MEPQDIRRLAQIFKLAKLAANRAVNDMTNAKADLEDARKSRDSSIDKMNKGSEADLDADPRAFECFVIEDAAQKEARYRLATQAYDQAAKGVATTKIAEVKAWERLVRVWSEPDTDAKPKASVAVA